MVDVVCGAEAVVVAGEVFEVVVIDWELPVTEIDD